MRNQKKLRLRPPMLIAAAVFAAGALAACEDTTAPPSSEAAAERAAPEASATNAETNRELAVLRRATARYHRVEAAIEDGFVQILPCMENPAGEGGLGIPHARLDRFDATIDLSEPEILFYEPQADGSLRLVGGEPVVPIAAWPESEPPSLFGREFHTNQEHGLYGLHMWVWRHNPDGMFAFWNPEVSCAAASEAA